MCLCVRVCVLRLVNVPLCVFLWLRSGRANVRTNYISPAKTDGVAGKRLRLGKSNLHVASQNGRCVFVTADGPENRRKNGKV